MLAVGVFEWFCRQNHSVIEPAVDLKGGGRDDHCFSGQQRVEAIDRQAAALGGESTPDVPHDRHARGVSGNGRRGDREVILSLIRKSTSSHVCHIANIGCSKKSCPLHLGTAVAVGLFEVKRAFFKENRKRRTGTERGEFRRENRTSDLAEPVPGATCIQIGITCDCHRALPQDWASGHWRGCAQQTKRGGEYECIFHDVFPGPRPMSIARVGTRHPSPRNFASMCKSEFVPTDGTRLPIIRSGGFGSSPFYGQLSGEQCACQRIDTTLFWTRCL